MQLKFLINRLILKLFPLRKPTLLALPNSILFIVFDALGDLILTTSVFREIKNIYPNIKIGVVATKRNKIILENNPFVDEVYESNKDYYLSNKKEWQQVKSIRQAQYDLVFDLWDRTSLTLLLKLKLFKPRKIVGLRKPYEVEQRKQLKTEDLGVYSDIIEIKYSGNFAERMLASLSYFDITPTSLKNDIFISENEKKIAQTFLESLQNNSNCFINFYGVSEDHSLPKLSRLELIKSFLGNDDFNLILSSGGNIENECWLINNCLSLDKERIKILPASLSIMRVLPVSMNESSLQYAVK